jgi:hypothetical protein
MGGSSKSERRNEKGIIVGAGINRIQPMTLDCSKKKHPELYKVSDNTYS